MGCANINKAFITNQLGFVWLGHNFYSKNIQRIKLLTGQLLSVLLVVSQLGGNM